jgi:hypothetical protein
VVVSEEVRIVGPNGEKVDVMTFRGSFERDVSAFAHQDPDMKQAVEQEDDDAVETLLQERFFHKPEMCYRRISWCCRMAFLPLHRICIMRSARSRCQRRTPS